MVELKLLLRERDNKIELHLHSTMVELKPIFKPFLSANRDDFKLAFSISTPDDVKTTGDRHIHFFNDHIYNNRMSHSNTTCELTFWRVVTPHRLDAKSPTS